MGQLSVGGVSAPFRPVLSILTESGTYIIPYAGWYRICAIGHGGQGAYLHWDNLSDYFSPGGAGGGGYLDIYLPSGAVLTVEITDASSTVTLDGVTLISSTAGSSVVDSSAKACLAGKVSGQAGVVAFPSNGTATPDVAPPEAYDEPYYRSSGGCKGPYKSGSDSTATVGIKSGGDGLFGGDGGDGGPCLFFNGSLSSGYVTAAAREPSRGAGRAGDGGAPMYNGTTYPYSGAGGGGGYGGGGGAVQLYWRYADEYNKVDDGGEGGAGCVRIERIR